MSATTTLMIRAYLPYLLCHLWQWSRL